MNDLFVGAEMLFLLGVVAAFLIVTGTATLGAFFGIGAAFLTVRMTTAILILHPEPTARRVGLQT
jgi:hypothetical protein